MKNDVRNLALSLSLLVALGGSLSAFAQQPETRQRENRKTEKTVTNYSTEKYYFTKNKLSKAALRKKLLKLPGVRKIDFDSRGTCINITFDPQQAPKDHLKKNLHQWGTPGDFNKPKTEQMRGNQESHTQQNQKGGQRPSLDER